MLEEFKRQVPYNETTENLKMNLYIYNQLILNKSAKDKQAASLANLEHSCQTQKLPQNGPQT